MLKITIIRSSGPAGPNTSGLSRGHTISKTTTVATGWATGDPWTMTLWLKTEAILAASTHSSWRKESKMRTLECCSPSRPASAYYREMKLRFWIRLRGSGPGQSNWWRSEITESVRRSNFRIRRLFTRANSKRLNWAISRRRRVSASISQSCNSQCSLTKSWTIWRSGETGATMTEISKVNAQANGALGRRDLHPWKSRGSRQSKRNITLSNRLTYREKTSTYRGW